MKMDTDFHTAKGESESSYSNNSRLQPLGCSSGENTLILVSQVIDAMSDSQQMEVQFFLNDLPENDFNYIFHSLGNFKESIAAEHKGGRIAGLPGSYYTRLFPSQSVHLFHSSCCLHWRSRLPDGLDVNAKPYLNKGNIYIAKTTTLSVVKLYQELFETDLLLFLKLRHEELVSGGQMVLTFLGRKNEDAYKGNLNHLCGLLAQSVQSLVHKGLVQEEKLDAFNLPVYGPSVDEVMAVVRKSELFNVSSTRLFGSNWDPYDDSGDRIVQDSLQSGLNVAKSIRAVMEPLFASHFGGAVLDELFREYARNVAKHLQREKTMYSVIVLFLQRR
ncbi:anthranilate O-methyltransferase 1-like [Panicum miliaceum]|uniref:Anthranilate O-methyltransferase 1-like n=1 Tax=Panicum miliaceum TaxID=4540 RepID=A0A3L6PG81_PANMI|nr:anthranilate O-methyltransferase 1-like [Panicum miliaceum]